MKQIDLQQKYRLGTIINIKLLVGGGGGANPVLQDFRLPHPHLL